MAWSYKREESSGFNSRIPEGRHRVRIAEADKAVSKNGNDMIVIKLDVSGYNELLYHYIVFMDDKPEITNRNLTQFFDSFKDIEEGDCDMSHWVGKVGACTVKHDDYNGNVKSKVGYFIHADKQGDLPAWKEPEGGVKGGADLSKIPTDGSGFMKIPEDVSDELPF